MDPNTGRIYEMDEKEAKEKGFVPVNRKLTEVERGKQQIALYRPCVCGSGKKLKFCCYTGGR